MANYSHAENESRDHKGRNFSVSIDLDFSSLLLGAVHFAGRTGSELFINNAFRREA